jgi:hypothetical protein
LTVGYVNIVFRGGIIIGSHQMSAVKFVGSIVGIVFKIY